MLGADQHRGADSTVDQAPLPWLLIIAAVLLSLLAAIWPLPFWARWIRPEWVAMLVIYWVIDSPFRLGMLFAALLGLALDSLEGVLLGQQTIGLIVVAYVAFLFHTRIRLASSVEQCCAVFLLVLLFELLEYWVVGMTGGGYFSVAMMLPALSSALLWPFFKLAISHFR